jgi:hypothetical protein
MKSINEAQGRGFPVMAMALALTVNAAFGYGLTKASTSGQRLFDAWNSGGTMVADTHSAALLRKATRG